MPHPLKQPLSLLASLALAAPVGAQTFSFDDSPTPADFTYEHVNDFVTGTISFNNSTGSGTDPYDVTPVSLKQTELALPGGTVTVYDICAEMFNGPTGTSTFDVSEGLGAFTSTEQAAIRALISNTLPDFIFAQTTLGYDAASEIGAAMQLAFWEIVEDGSTTYSLDEGGGFAGLLSVRQAGTSQDTVTQNAISLAESYLADIESGTFTDQGNIGYYFADAETEQDRLWFKVGTTPIPEPSTGLLALFGSLLLLRRRRRAPPSGRATGPRRLDLAAPMRQPRTWPRRSSSTRIRSRSLRTRPNTGA